MSPLFAAPRLTIVEMVNISGNADYDYLKATITEAIREELHKKFSFNEPDAATIANTLKSNPWLIPDDLGSRTAGFNLGRLTEQDIILNGTYDVRTSKKGSSLVVQIWFLDVAESRIAAGLRQTAPIDGNIFGSIAKIAEDLSAAGKTVLPGKDAKGDALNKRYQERIGILTLHAGYAPQYPGTAVVSELKSQSTFEVPRLGANFSVGVEYLLRRKFFRYLYPALNTEWQFRFSEIAVEKSTKKADIAAHAFSGFFYFYFPLIETKRYAIMLGLGGGASVFYAKLNYAALAPDLPLVSGVATDKSSYLTYAPRAALRLRGMYNVTDNFALGVGFVYSSAFFQQGVFNNVQGEIYASLGI